jgi:hypothetical protein
VASGSCGAEYERRPFGRALAERTIEGELHIVPRLRDRAVREVPAPAPHRAVQRASHVLPRRLIPGPQPATNGVLYERDSLLRWPHPVVAGAGPRQVHRAEGVAEEIEGVASGVPQPRLVLVQREPDTGHPAPSRLQHLGRPVAGRPAAFLGARRPQPPREPRFHALVADSAIPACHQGAPSPSCSGSDGP